MTQIKLSIALVLAAATIAPVVAQPLREGDEFSSNVVHLPHHHHHHHGHHHHHQSATPVERSSLESTSGTLSPREYYAEEFEVRGLFDDSEPEIATRESDDLFERQESEGAESSASTLPHSLPFVHSFAPNGGAFSPHKVRIVIPSLGIGPREFTGTVTESEEMLERDFEDFEDFDARELDDDLYLD